MPGLALFPSVDLRGRLRAGLRLMGISVYRRKAEAASMTLLEARRLSALDILLLRRLPAVGCCTLIRLLGVTSNEDSKCSLASIVFSHG